MRVNRKSKRAKLNQIKELNFSFKKTLVFKLKAKEENHNDKKV